MNDHDVTYHEWTVRGFQFIISERPHGPISLFTCTSLDGLVFDLAPEHSLPAMIGRIEEHLPGWIVRARSDGIDVDVYDPSAAPRQISGSDSAREVDRSAE
jgi:hypothetical protein